MNHDQSPSAGQPAPHIDGDTRTDMIDQINLVKDYYGTTYAKALIESFGVNRMYKLLPGHYHAAFTTATAMIAEFDRTSKGQHAALAILVKHIDDWQDHWRPNIDYRNIESVLHDFASPPNWCGTPPLKNDKVYNQFEAGEPLKLTPNDIIACLLDIALKAQYVVTHGISNADGEALRNYHALADAFAPLQQLPGPLDWTPAERAKIELTSFIQGASVTAPDPGFIEVRNMAKPVNVAYPVRNYDDAYVEQLAVAVSDLATDGKRFRTMLWVLDDGHDEPRQRARDILDDADTTTENGMRDALDAVYRANLMPDMPAKYIDGAHAYDVLRGEALTLAQKVVATYLRTSERDIGMWVCQHCNSTMPNDGDTLAEAHDDDCAVTLARQLIENES